MRSRSFAAMPMSTADGSFLRAMASVADLSITTRTAQDAHAWRLQARSLAISLAHGLHEQAAARLRTLLVEGHIAPGAKLNERELAEALHVSRTPLREAIKMLAAEGLVDLLPNRGAVAVKLGEPDIVHAFELLAELEGLAGELAAARADEAQRNELRALHFEMLACHARRDLSGYYRLNAQIHAGIAAAITPPSVRADRPKVPSFIIPPIYAGAEPCLPPPERQLSASRPRWAPRTCLCLKSPNSSRRCGTGMCCRAGNRRSSRNRAAR